MERAIKLLILCYIVLSQTSCKESDSDAKCSFAWRGVTYVPDKAGCYGDGFTVLETYSLSVQEPGTIAFTPDVSVGIIYADNYFTDSGTIVRNGNNFSFSGNLDMVNSAGEILGSGYISGDCSCVGP